MTNMPYGAIDSVDFLRNLLDRVRNGESITLYQVYGHRFGIYQINLTDQSCLKAEEGVTSQSSLKLFLSKYEYFYLPDFNVGSGRYNYNYIFIDETLARDYIRYLREYKSEEIQNHNQRYQDIWDDYDDLDDYDRYID